jgi:hypothetical protein
VGSDVPSVEKSSVINPMPEDMPKTLTTKSLECSLVIFARDPIRIMIPFEIIKGKAMDFTNSN